MSDTPTRLSTIDAEASHDRRGGFLELLAVAVPLVLATGSHSVQMFVDRLFLSWYSTEAIAAVVPAGMLMWTCMALFMSTVGYVNTFVSQYHGAGEHSRIGASVWHSVYLALASYAIMLPLWFAAPLVFGWADHPEAVQQHETTYFRILLLGCVFPLLNIALSALYSGRGRTHVVMLVAMTATAINVVLDYLLIFGKLGFPRLGIVGAAYATVIATACASVIYVALFLSRANRRTFATGRVGRVDVDLIRRLLRYGAPHGVQNLITAVSWTFWLFVVGGLGTIQLAATNVVWSINALAILPTLGISQGVQILVGRHLGADRDDLAAKTTRHGVAMALLFMGSFGLVYVHAPGIILALFESNTQVADFSRVAALAVTLLHFVALYSIFDALIITYAGALRGAGDTRFTMMIFLVLSIVALVVPTLVAVAVFRQGLFAVWVIATAYCVLLAAALAARYRQGKWRHMRVIESHGSPGRET